MSTKPLPEWPSGALPHFGDEYHRYPATSGMFWPGGGLECDSSIIIRR
jgi:hypothetical protein